MKMVGLHTCLKNAYVINNIRIAKEKCGIQQFIRRRYLTNAISNVKKSYNCKKPNSTFDFQKYVRYSSTNVIGIEKELDSFANGANSHGTVIGVSTQTSAELVQGSKTTSDTFIDESLLPSIPVPPVEQIKPDAITAITDFTQIGLKEPTLQSLGLGSWWPTGWIQRSLEILHINFDLPWWGAVVAVTATLRLLIFPLYIKSRINNVNLQNNLPQLQVLQLKVNEARQTGNYYEAAHLVSELQKFIKDKNISTAGMLVPIAAQVPVFLSMFWGLRGMTNLPVESMKSGGGLWFTDLTLPDPYYILPLVISTTLYVIIETGAEGNSSKNIQYIWLKYGLKIFPLIIFPFTMNFCSALQLYWVISNMIALGQTLVFKIPIVRTTLNIPPTISYDESQLPMKKKGKKKGPLSEIRESLTNAKLLRELEDRERLNTVTFEKAGTCPVPRTFKKNPRK